MLWLAWDALWTLFFLLLGLGWSRLTAFTGWSLILTSQVTTTIPALLGLTGNWPTTPASAGVAFVVVALLFGAAAVLATRAARAQPATIPDAAIPDAASAATTHPRAPAAEPAAAVSS